MVIPSRYYGSICTSHTRTAPSLGFTTITPKFFSPRLSVTKPAVISAGVVGSGEAQGHLLRLPSLIMDSRNVYRRPEPSHVRSAPSHTDVLHTLPCSSRTDIWRRAAAVPLPCLDILPVELRMVVFEHLDIVDLVCLAFTHRNGRSLLTQLRGAQAVSRALGGDGGRRTVDRRGLLDRKEMLCRLARDVPQQHLCSTCVKLHPDHVQNLDGCNERYVRLTSDAAGCGFPNVLPSYIVQGLMRLYVREPFKPSVEAEVASSCLAMTWSTVDSKDRTWEHRMISAFAVPQDPSRRD